MLAMQCSKITISQFGVSRISRSAKYSHKNATKAAITTLIMQGYQFR